MPFKYSNTLYLIITIIILSVCVSHVSAGAPPFCGATFSTLSWPNSVTQQCYNKDKNGNPKAEKFYQASDKFRAGINDYGYGFYLSQDDRTIFWHELTDGYSGGQDDVDSNIDDARVAAVFTHGGGISNWSRMKLKTTTKNNNPDNDCFAKSDQMLFGDHSYGSSQVKFLNLHACDSTQLEFMDNSTGGWRASAYGIWQIHGYDGTSYSGDINDETYDYAQEALWSLGGAAWAFLEHQTEFDAYPDTGKDVCAHPVAFGDSYSEAMTNRDERIFCSNPSQFLSVFPSPNYSGVIYCACDSPGGGNRC